MSSKRSNLRRDDHAIHDHREGEQGLGSRQDAQRAGRELAYEDRQNWKIAMCRSIKTLHNFAPPATDEEIRAAALQFVRKLSGFNKPSQVNMAAFVTAVSEITAVSTKLLQSLETNAPPRDREAEAAKARLRAAQTFGT